MADIGAKAGWKVFNGLAAVAAAVAARKAVEAAWKVGTGKEPPDSPESLVVSWGEALGWAALSGTVIAFARIVASRSAAATWMRSTGSLPPGMHADSKAA